MFDHSRPLPAGSKWRQRMTPVERAQAADTDKRLRIETQAMEAGAAPRAQSRRSRAKPKPPGDVEMATLGAFIGEHGHAIAPLLAQGRDEPQRVALIRAYRDMLGGAQGTHERWGKLLRDLDF